MAEIRHDATAAFGKFVQTYELKFPKATLCLEEYCDELLALYDFSVNRWQSLRTANPIESTFTMIRHCSRAASKTA